MHVLLRKKRCDATPDAAKNSLVRHMQRGEDPSLNDDGPLLQLEADIDAMCVAVQNCVHLLLRKKQRCYVTPAKLDAELSIPPAA